MIDPKIKKEIVDIFGKEKAIEEKSALAKHGNPDLIVLATTRAQIINLIKLAGKHKFPIVPKSSTIDYYDGAIALNGGVLLDMSNMKKILSIRDGSDRCVTIEPGVTYEQLQKYLNAKGFKCMVPLGLPASASVLSSYLERVPLLSAPTVLCAEGSQCIMDMEVVRGDGTILRTGSGETVPDRPGISPNGPIGPDWTRVFTAAQGTMGIVTDMTLKFKHIPAYQKLLFKAYDDLNQMLTDMTRMKRIDIGKECLGISALNLATMVAKEKGQIESLKNLLPKWMMVLNLIGQDEQEIKLFEEDLRDLKITFSNAVIMEETSKIDLEKVFKEEFNLPKKLVAHRDYKKKCHVIPFYATKASVLEFNKEIAKIAKDAKYEPKDLNGFVMPTEQARIFYIEYGLHSDSDDINPLFEKISEYVINKGGVIDRPYGIWRKMIYSKIPTYLKILKEAKKILDPYNIFNPGKIPFDSVKGSFLTSPPSTASGKNIIAELKAIVGDQFASDDPAVRFAHTRDQFVKTRGPDYVIVVSNREQIIEVLKLAYKHNVPVIPKGTGANISGAVIPEKGGIILDLKKMNNILEIDKENMTATVEPGVSMGQLQIEAWKRGLFIPEPSGPHVVKVIANLIQCRGISTYSAKYGIGDQHTLGFEWILPNGEVVQMGCYANPAGEKSENWMHISGSDLTGAFLFAFGTLGVCPKAKVKLYPIMEKQEGGAADRYVAICGKLEEDFKIIQGLVKYDVYKNIFMTRWPYLAMMFGIKKKDSQTMMRRSFFEAMITVVLEGSERRVNYYAERLDKIVKSFNFKGIITGPLQHVQGQMMQMTDPGEHSRLAPIQQEPRRLLDFMWLSARAFRVHGAFGGNTPLLSLDDACDIFRSSEKAATEYAPRPNEIACYFQPVDDYHYALQEMDLYMDQFDPVDFKKNMAAHQIGSYYSILRRRDCLVFYIYFAHDFNEAVMTLLAPGYMRLLKNWKTAVDPNSIMNRRKGIMADKDYDTMEVKL